MIGWIFYVIAFILFALAASNASDSLVIVGTGFAVAATLRGFKWLSEQV